MEDRKAALPCITSRCMAWVEKRRLQRANPGAAPCRYYRDHVRYRLGGKEWHAAIIRDSLVLKLCLSLEMLTFKS